MFIQWLLLIVALEHLIAGWYLETPNINFIFVCRSMSQPSDPINKCCSTLYYKLIIWFIFSHSQTWFISSVAPMLINFETFIYHLELKKWRKSSKDFVSDRFVTKQKVAHKTWRESCTYLKNISC